MKINFFCFSVSCWLSLYVVCDISSHNYDKGYRISIERVRTGLTMRLFAKYSRAAQVHYVVLYSRAVHTSPLARGPHILACLERCT